MSEKAKRKRGLPVGSRHTIDGKRLSEVPTKKLLELIAEGHMEYGRYWSELARRDIRRRNFSDWKKKAEQQGIDPRQIGQM